jgi:quercetin dioxygenase-like cupin family protein
VAGIFRVAGEFEPIKFDWGFLRWMSNQQSTGATQLTAFEATILPNKGHSFHKHTQQEEVLYVVGGNVEQWIDREKRILGAGDSVFIPSKVVHASFNAGPSDAKVVVIFSPCIGDIGFEAVELGREAPWNTLRR